MKKFLHSRYGASKGAALIIVLAFVVLATGLSLAYFSRTTTDRQLAQSSYNDTSADLLARSALDITVSDLKQEIATNQPVTQPIFSRHGTGDTRIAIPNLIRRSFSEDPTGAGASSCQLWPLPRRTGAFDYSRSLEQPLLDPASKRLAPIPPLWPVSPHRTGCW